MGERIRKLSKKKEKIPIYIYRTFFTQRYERNTLKTPLFLEFLVFVSSNLSIRKVWASTRLMPPIGWFPFCRSSKAPVWTSNPLRPIASSYTMPIIKPIVGLHSYTMSTIWWIFPIFMCFLTLNTICMQW